METYNGPVQFWFAHGPAIGVVIDGNRGLSIRLVPREARLLGRACAAWFGLGGRSSRHNEAIVEHENGQVEAMIVSPADGLLVSLVRGVGHLRRVPVPADVRASQVEVWMDERLRLITDPGCSAALDTRALRGVLATLERPVRSTLWVARGDGQALRWWFADPRSAIEAHCDANLHLAQGLPGWVGERQAALGWTIGGMEPQGSQGR